LNSPAVFVVTRTLKILVNMLAHVSQVANVVLRKSIEIPKIDGFEQTQPTGPFAVLYHLPRCNHEQMALGLNLASQRDCAVAASRPDPLPNSGLKATSI